MNKTSGLKTWQIVLITTGVILVFGPTVWDELSAFIKEVANIELADIFTRHGMLIIGIILLAIAGIYELVKDMRDKPTSKHIK